MCHPGFAPLLLEMRILRRRHRPACAWQTTGPWHCPACTDVDAIKAALPERWRPQRSG